MNHTIFFGETVWDALVHNMSLDIVEEEELELFCKEKRPELYAEVTKQPANKGSYIELLHMYRDWEAGR